MSKNDALKKTRKKLKLLTFWTYQAQQIIVSFSRTLQCIDRDQRKMKKWCSKRFRKFQISEPWKIQKMRINLKNPAKYQTNIEDLKVGSQGFNS